MRIAIPIWKERVSPVFDVAKHLLVVDIEDSTEVARELKTVTEDQLTDRAQYLADLRVEFLICGAISRSLELILGARGVGVIPQFCGTAEEILQAFLSGTISDRRFLMPGCKVWRRDCHSLSDGYRDQLKDRSMPMRIVITSQGPELTSQVDPRFGRAKYLIVLDTENEEFRALDNSQNVNAPRGAGIRAAKNVISESVEAVVTGHVGPKALEALESARIQVYCGASGTVEDALRKLKSGQLESFSKSGVG